MNDVNFTFVESDGLLRVSGQLDSIEEELAVVKLMIAQERQILANIKVMNHCNYSLTVSYLETNRSN